MKLSKLAILAALSVVSSLSVDLNAQGKKAPSVEAEFVTHYKLPDGRVFNSVGHYYRNSRGQVREDSGTSGQIFDTNARTVTMLNHQMRTAVVYQVPADDALANARASGMAALKPIPFGRGVMDGHQLTKARLIGPNGSKHEIWTADDLGFVVMRRTEVGNTTTTKTFRNLRVAEPDASVFEIPRGYSVTKTALDPNVRTAPPTNGRKPAGRGRGGR